MIMFTVHYIHIGQHKQKITQYQNKCLIQSNIKYVQFLTNRIYLNVIYISNALFVKGRQKSLYRFTCM